MNRNRLFIQYDLCFGCHACEVACQQENGLPAGLKWLSVKQVGPKQVNGKLAMDFIPMTCMHCGKPPCMDVCPVEAITKGTDGIVRISRDLCIGCGFAFRPVPSGRPGSIRIRMWLKSATCVRTGLKRVSFPPASRPAPRGPYCSENQLQSLKK